MAAATFSAAGRRLLSTAAAAAEKTELPVPIAQLRRLARAGRLADIDEALAPLLPSHTVAALSALSSVGLPDRASALVGTIASPTAAHLNAVLGPLLRRRRLAGLVPSILAAHASVPRDASTDSILAKSLCLTSGTDSALHLLREPSSGSAPSLHLFTALIDSFYRQRLPHRAEELWHAMVQDHGIAPDAAAYNARITYKSANGTVDEVKELIRVMREEAGLAPDVVTYNALARAMARHKRVDEAVEVYRGMEAGEVEGVVPDCATYTCVVGALCGAERWSEAEDVFYDGVKRQKVANLGTVQLLVRGLKGAGKGRAARRVVVGLRKKLPEQFDGPWRELEEAAGLPASGKEDDGDDDSADADEQPVHACTHSSKAQTSLRADPKMLSRLAPPLAGALPRVLRGICTAAPPPPKPPPAPLSPSELGTISALLPRLLSAGHVPAAGRLLSAALLLPGSTERLPLPDLAAHLASLPSLSAAFALLTALRHHPARPSPLPLASPLLDGLLSQRRARDAASVLRWLCRPDSPCRPDAPTYAAAVAGFCRLEDPRAALAALREMAADGLQASPELREAVQEAMLQDARIEEAWALEDAMQLPETSKVVDLVDKLLSEWEP